MNFWSFLTRPGDNHDENILQFREACRSSRFCCESHDFLTFLTTRLPISWFLVKYHSEMKCFFVKKNGNVYCCWIVSDSPHVNGEWIASCKRLRDGFARHSLQYLSKSVPVWAYLYFFSSQVLKLSMFSFPCWSFSSCLSWLLSCSFVWRSKFQLFHLSQCNDYYSQSSVISMIWHLIDCSNHCIALHYHCQL